jgi:hypothetical protein
MARAGPPPKEQFPQGYLRFGKLFLASLKWHFGQVNVSEDREDHDDFRAVTAIGHALHTGQATRTTSADSSSPIEFPLPLRIFSSPH